MVETTARRGADPGELERLRLASRLNGLPEEGIAPPQRHDAVIGGMRLHRVDWGNEGAPPVLFLHGGGITARSWDTVCLALRRDFHCVALDQRGHGDSEWSPEVDYGPEAHLRDIEGLVERLGLERFLLAGQSMGGMNSMLYASRHSDRLRGLVLVDVTPTVRTEGAASIRSFMEKTTEIESIEALVAQAIAFQPLRDPELLRMSVMHNVRRLPDGGWMRKNDMRFFMRTSVEELAARAEAAWEWVPRITCPTLVVRGGESKVVRPEDAERLAKALPNARTIEIAGAGHNIQGDRPIDLAEAIRDFEGEIGNGQGQEGIR